MLVSLTRSLRGASSSGWYSKIKKLGVLAAKCAFTTVATGPIGLCGATITPWASAIAAIFFISKRPPQTQMSG
jgi:hypothetical protein